MAAVKAVAAAAAGSVNHVSFMRERMDNSLNKTFLSTFV